MLMLLQAAGEQPDTGWVAEAILRGFVNGLLIAWPVLAILAGLATLVTLFRLVRWIVRRRSLSRSGIDDIDRMGGKVFEQYLEVLFSRLGYSVERTRFVGDYGGDLVLRKGGIRTVVQAKRYAKSVGVKAIQEAVAAKGYYDCTAAMVVSNSNYTRPAQELARKNSVVLWGRERLIGKLAEINAKRKIREGEPNIHEPQNAVTAGSVKSDLTLADVATCNTCAKLLTPGERRYCETNSKRFSGQMFCFRHQRVKATPN